MKFRNIYSLPLACGALLVAAGMFFAQTTEQQEEREDLAPHGKGIGTMYEPGRPGSHFGQKRAAGFARVTGNGINYHNGPVVTGTTNVYFIWYGTWATGSQNILTAWANSIGGSPYFNINTTYYSGSTSKAYVSNSVAYKGMAMDSYSQGTTLSDASVQTVVSSAISSGKLPLDTNALYFVLTSADVNESSGFCTQYCGWHWYGTISGKNVKYSFIGNPTRCPSACAAQTTSSPNGDIGADAMVSIMSHELEETVTDPNGNAWYDSRGYENGDKCAWNFGATFTAPNGSKANVTLAGAHYLIQQNWVNAGGGYCALKY